MIMKGGVEEKSVVAHRGLRGRTAEETLQGGNLLSVPKCVFVMELKAHAFRSR